MPAGKDDDNSAACVQSGTHRGLVLVPQLIAVGGRFSLGAVLDGVIDDKQVCAIAGDGAADTNGDHASHAVVEVPVRFGGLHLGDGMPKQRRTELLDLIVVLCGLFPTPEALVFTGFCGIASHFLCPLDALYFRHQQTAMRILTLSVSCR